MLEDVINKDLNFLNPFLNIDIKSKLFYLKHFLMELCHSKPNPFN